MIPGAFILPHRRCGAITRSLWLAGAVCASAEPVISEFMASNAPTLKDGHGNYSDWVEIRNEGSSPTNLTG